MGGVLFYKGQSPGSAAAGCEWAGTRRGTGFASSGEYALVLEPSWGTSSFSRRTGCQKVTLLPSLFSYTSVLTVGLGARLEKVPRATDAISTSPVGEAPSLERDLLVFQPDICSFQYVVRNAALNWIK